jgi:hypothetical protein
VQSHRPNWNHNALKKGQSFGGVRDFGAAERSELSPRPPRGWVTFSNQSLSRVNNGAARAAARKTLPE